MCYTPDHIRFSYIFIWDLKVNIGGPPKWANKEKEKQMLKYITKTGVACHNPFSCY